MSIISRQTQNDQVSSVLRHALKTGEFSPGEVLTIRRLEQAYGVSTTPVREALRSLVAERTLTVLPNRSIAVPLLTREHFDELRQIRGVLEGLCGELAARNIDKTMLRATRRLYDEMNVAIANDDVSAYLRANEEFHRTIYSQSGCDILLGYVEQLWVQVGPYFRLLRGEAGWSTAANSAHRLIIEALDGGEPEAIRDAIKRDIDTSGADIMAKLDAPINLAISRGL